MLLETVDTHPRTVWSGIQARVAGLDGERMA